MASFTFALGMSPRPAPADIVECFKDGVLVSRAYDVSDGHPVSTELDWSGDRYATLRARPTKGPIGPWELYTFCRYSEGWWTVYSQGAGKYVSVDIRMDSYNGLLRATADGAGSLEQFRLSTGACGSDALSSIQNVSTGKYVSAEIDWSGDDQGVLRSRSDVAGCSEAFTTGSG